MASFPEGSSRNPEHQTDNMKVILLTCLAAVALARPDRTATILRDDRVGPNIDGSYSYAYETSNQIAANEDGTPGIEGQINAQGGYAYTDLEGNRFEVTYVADENGFKPVGAHIPQDPPHVADLLRIAAEQRAQGITFTRK